MGFDGSFALIVPSSILASHIPSVGDAIDALRSWANLRRQAVGFARGISSYPAAVKAVFPYLYHDPAPFQRDSALVAEACAINRTPNAREATYWLQRALNFDFALPDPSQISSVTVPTLILWGREDRVADVGTAKRFAQDIAGSRLVVIDDAGHSVHMEKPDAVNRAITSFLDAIRW